MGGEKGNSVTVNTAEFMREMRQGTGLLACF